MIDLKTHQAMVSREMTFVEKCAVGLSSHIKTNDFDIYDEYVDSGGGVSMNLNFESCDMQNEKSSVNFTQGEIKLETICEEEEDHPEEYNNADVYEKDPKKSNDFDPNVVIEQIEPEKSGRALRSSRVSRLPERWWNAFSTVVQQNATVATSARKIPNSYKEAMSEPDVDFW